MAKPVPNPNVPRPPLKASASRWNLITRSPEGLGLYSAKDAPDAIYVGRGSGTPDLDGREVAMYVAPAWPIILSSVVGCAAFSTCATAEGRSSVTFPLPLSTAKYLIGRGWKIKADSLARDRMADWLDAFRLTL